MGNKRVSEIRIGNTTYIVTAECSPTATETVEKKLERLILRHVADAIKLQNKDENRFAKCSDQSEYGMDNE
jgi:hypothetical protein